MMQSTTTPQVILHLSRNPPQPLQSTLHRNRCARSRALCAVSRTTTKLIGARRSPGIRPRGLANSMLPILTSENLRASASSREVMSSTIQPRRRWSLSRQEMARKSTSVLADGAAACTSNTPISRGGFHRRRPTRVYEVRKNFGAQLARRKPCRGRCRGAGAGFRRAAALGYSQHSGVPFELGIKPQPTRVRAATFIQPSHSWRGARVAQKHSANRASSKARALA